MNSSPLRLDPEFKDILKKLKVERIRRGVDNEPKSDRRLSKAIARLVRTDLKTYETLINSELENDRKTRGRRK